MLAVGIGKVIACILMATKCSIFGARVNVDLLNVSCLCSPFTLLRQVVVVRTAPSFRTSGRPLISQA
jgi:hypothetical protein